MAILRGYIYEADLGSVSAAVTEKSSEQAGRRPVLILSANHIPNSWGVAIIVPGTRGWKRPNDLPIWARVSAAESGLKEETVFFCFHVRALDKKKIQGKPVGQLTGDALRRVEDAVGFCLGIR